MLLDRQVSIQLKATDHLRTIQGGRFVVVDIDVRDLRAWSSRLEPVILVLFSATRNRAYWLYVQASDQCIMPAHKGQTIRSVRIPSRQTLNLSGIEQFARYNRQVVEQVQLVLKHEC
jgi:hypothetical protein